MHNFFVNPNDIVGNKIRIHEDAGHISRVLRLNIGDKIIVFNGIGGEFHCVLSEVDKSECIATIEEIHECASEPKLKVTLFQGIPKREKMEWIIQKCTELGVSEIYPVITKFTVVKFANEKDKIAKAERWQKIALEASKQCGRGVVPIVHLPIPFDESVKKASQLDSAIMPYEVLALDKKKDFRTCLANNTNCENMGIIIGPEGGFCESEAKLANANGIDLAGLGARILRTETAAIAALAIVMYENEEI